jgi:uncharacterized protein
MSKFYIKKATNGQFYFYLTGSNGEPILTSETYTTKQSCKDGIDSVRRHCTFDSCFRKRTATNGQYYFTLESNNSQVIGTSETYTTASGRDHGIVSVKENGPKAPVDDLTPINH